jgi:hypothetical protein
MKTKIAIAVVLVCSAIPVLGQIVNTLSKDNTNMYVHAVDSVVKMGIGYMKLKRVFLISWPEIRHNFPDSVNSIPVVHVDRLEKARRRPKLKDNEIQIALRPVSIIRDEHTITISAADKNGFFGDGLYVFYYVYTPETRTYVLRKLMKGIRL